MKQADYFFRYIVVGDSNVGKSNILYRFVYNKFKTDHNATVGVEFFCQNLKIEDKQISLQVWDTAGQETFKSITRNYYKNAACALLIYDISEMKSFINIKNWLEECKECCPTSTLFVLIGNKCDKEEERQVLYDEAAKFAKHNKMLFYETSARTGENIEKESAREILGKIENGEVDTKSKSSGIKDGFHQGNSTLDMIINKADPGDKKKKCC